MITSTAVQRIAGVSLAVAVTGYEIPAGAAVFAQVTGLVAGMLVGTVGLRIVSGPVVCRSVSGRG